MPRTKRKSKNTTKQTRDNASIDKETRKQETESYLREIDFNCKFILESIDAECDTRIKEAQAAFTQFKATLPSRVLTTRLEDLPKVLFESTHCITISDTVSHSNILEITNAVKSVKARKNKRSVSATDEGYITADNSANSGGSSRSRGRQLQVKEPRVSRSLSRNKASHNQPPIFKTPLNKAPPTDYGIVTPKVKPNTPQVILRRPKEGEMAISMQGSPLMVNTIVSREANVNIPLEDGRTISIQPQHGLRMSQLPNIDHSIKRQIEILRDNLIKVCEQVDSNRNK